MDHFTIRGGAGLYEAAAVAAVVTELLAEEEVERSKPPRQPVPPAWVRSGLMAPFGRFTPPVSPE
jgi:hypothetical protein